LLDELLKEYKNPEDLLGKDGLLKQLSAALVERCLNAEMDYHLEEECNDSETEGTRRNQRNGHSKKTVKGEFGEAEISIPRDRNGAFEPVIVKKHETRFNGFSYPVSYGGKPSSRAVRGDGQHCEKMDMPPVYVAKPSRIGKLL
jgi:putative transposase